MAKSNSSSALIMYRRRRSRAAVHDRLMSLPSELLDNILSRLPFEQLVRTSSFSGAWRRRWESVPNLDIRVSPGFSPAPHPSLLRRCAPPVRSFTARINYHQLESTNDWLSSIVDKRVQKLAVDVMGVGLPALFSFHELVHLNLSGRFYLPQARRGFAGFPKLLTLTLNRVRLPSEGGGLQLQRFISFAPDLRELSLIDVGTTAFASQTQGYMCSIRAPKLRVLKLVMSDDNDLCWLAGYFPLLEVAVIFIQCLLCDTKELVQTFRCISNVKSLTFHTNSNKVDESPLDGISCKFQNLKVGSLSVNFGKLSSIESIFSLLRCAPHIEKLEIKVEKPKRPSDEYDVDYEYDQDDEYDDPPLMDDFDLGFYEDIVENEIDEDILNEKASDDLFVNLKHVLVTDIKFFMPNEICFMKFLLSKTRSLESFVGTFHSEEMMNYACAISATWRKASAQAKISLSVVNELAPNPDDF